MNWICLLSILIVINCSAQAQKRVALSAGLNVTSLSSVSKFELQNSYNIKPGFFLGFSIVPKENFLANFQLELVQIGLKSIQLTDISGVSIGTSKSKYSNLNLNLGLLYRKRINNFVFGLGMSPQLSLISKVINDFKFQGNSSFPNSIIDDKMKSDNKSRRSLILQMPVQIEYDLGKIHLLLKYERSLFSWLKSSQSAVKEYENDFKIGISYYLDSADT